MHTYTSKYERGKRRTKEKHSRVVGMKNFLFDSLQQTVMVVLDSWTQGLEEIDVFGLLSAFVGRLLKLVMPVYIGQMLVLFEVAIDKVTHRLVPLNDYRNHDDHQENCMMVLLGSSSSLARSRIALVMGQLILFSAVVYSQKEIRRSDSGSSGTSMSQKCK